MREHNVKPNVKTYGALLKVIASSHLPDKAEKARRIFQDMMNESLMPSIHEYNDLLHCCTFVHGDEERKRKAFCIAVEAFDSIHNSEDLRPNLLTYTRYFQACVNGMNDNETSNAIRKGYERCCDSGFGNHPQVKKTMEKFAS